MRTKSPGTRAISAVGLAAVAVIALTLALVSQSQSRSDEAKAGGPDPSLTEAVAAGDVVRVRSMLDRGADPDRPRVYGFTPLMRAAIRDDVSMIELLVDAGASLDATAPGGLTAWHIAAEADAAAALDVFIAAGANLGIRSLNGMNTLEHAAAGGSSSAIVTIAATGADLNEQSEIVTLGHGYPIDRGSTALGIAARAGHIEAVRTLLELGADVDAPSLVGQTPLQLAIFSGQSSELVAMLLNAGADPAVRASCRTRCSYEEADALTRARRLGDPEVVPLLESALGN